MKILVTGAGGFVGRLVCRRLVEKGHQVFGLSAGQPPAEFRSILTGYYVQDIGAPFQLSVSFDCVIHLAAYNITHVGDLTASAYDRVNVQGTRHVLAGIKADRFIFLSTVKVYKNEGRPLTEESPLAPVSAYEKSKLEAEKICRSMWPEQQLIILRSANILGPGQAPKAVVPVFFQRARRNEPLEIIVSGRTPMQFVAVEDIADAFEAVLLHPQARGIFNVASHEIVTVEELAGQIMALTGSASALNIHNRQEVLTAPVVCEKAKRELGWQAKTGLPDLLRDYYTHGVEKN